MDTEYALFLRSKVFESQDDTQNPNASPLLADNFSKLPPCKILVAGFDPLKDDGKLYFQKMLDAKVPATLSEYTVCPHNWMFAVDSDHKTEARYECLYALKKAFGEIVVFEMPGKSSFRAEVVDMQVPKAEREVGSEYSALFTSKDIQTTNMVDMEEEEDMSKGDYLESKEALGKYSEGDGGTDSVPVFQDYWRPSTDSQSTGELPEEDNQEEEKAKRQEEDEQIEREINEKRKSMTQYRDIFSDLDI